jgi:hypothetical protein
MLPTPPTPAPAQIAQTGLVIEPPPWKTGELGPPPAVAAEPPAPTALDQIRLAEEGFDPPAPGPPVVLEPLRRYEVPEVDWREEERERAAREGKPPTVVELEAPKAKASATPNLDAAERLIQELRR